MPVVTIKSPGSPPVTCRIDEDAITIGRAVSNHIVVHDPLLSRVHAELRRVETTWFVMDRGSRNGVRVNGRAVDGHAPVARGDEIEMGNTSLQFEVAAQAGLSDTPPTRTRDAATVVVADDDTVLAGSSEAMKRLRADIRRVAASDVSVLIVGENGTGKELVAQCIHRESPREQQPFIVVNCPALASSLVEAELFGVERRVATDVDARVGRLELARGGTLLLDEIGDLELTAQAKLLRFLQTKTFERVGGREVLPVDVRILAATNQDLAAAIETGRFRRDLYHRLNVVCLKVPPLRDRREDVPELVELFLKRSARPRARMSATALELLSRYDFPGNVRELEHAVSGAVIFADHGVVEIEHLPESVRSAVAEARPDLYARIVTNGESFWTVVREPYLRRQLPADDVRRLVRRARDEGGGTVRGMARVLGVDAEYRKLLDFLRNHGLL